MNNFEDRFQLEVSEWSKRGCEPARIIAEHKGRYTILLNNKEFSAEITGKMMFAAETRKDYPAVGDFVAVQSYGESSPAIIHHILPRKTILSRKTSGREIEEQIIATNMDIVFIVQGLDNNFNLRRLERFLVVASHSGATPVILLSKIDLLDEETLMKRMEEVRGIAAGTTIISYSAKTLVHIDQIKSLIQNNSTICFIGSSGSGKSTLINRLLGREKLQTQEVREDDSRGKHTTTHRELIALENGGSVIDTPGLREIGLWDAGSSVSETFQDIDDLSLSCKFTDCSHLNEPGCAILAAMENGTIDEGRYVSFMKLKKEAEYIESKSSITKQQERKSKEKRMHKDLNALLKMKGKR